MDGNGGAEGGTNSNPEILKNTQGGKCRPGEGWMLSGWHMTPATQQRAPTLLSLSSGCNSNGITVRAEDRLGRHWQLYRCYLHAQPQAGAIYYAHFADEQTGGFSRLGNLSRFTESIKHRARM